MINRLRWQFHELDPEQAPQPASLDRSKHREKLAAWLHNRSRLRAELARITGYYRLTHRSDQRKAKRIGERVRQIALLTLLALPGCGELTAAKLVGEAAGVIRFVRGGLACHAGVAPIPVRGRATPPAGSR